MLPLAPLLAKPLVKYGLMIVGPILIASVIYAKGYYNGKGAEREVCQAALNETIAAQAKASNQQLVQAHELTVRIDELSRQADKTREEQAEAIKRKVASHASKKPAIPLSPEFVALYDELRRVPNQAGVHPRSTDASASGSHVSGGEVPTPSSQLVQIFDENGEAIELTTDELQQAVTDAFIKLGEIKDDYSALSAWNDGRERIELERLSHEKSDRQ